MLIPEHLRDSAGEFTFSAGHPRNYSVEGDHLIDEWKGEKTEALPMAKGTFLRTRILAGRHMFE
jgi:hypothetical protein